MRAALVVALLLSVRPAFADNLLSSVPPEHVLNACYGKLKAELDEVIVGAAYSNWNAAKVAELTAQAADLQKRLDEAEAKIVELQRGAPLSDQNQ